ncbi:sigma-70 family RNA polymerase sigma factor [Cellulomonas cellasea]|uniref:sigma-70 family RNA polymerase sigma factor n=1 Tax=Cellulomonas cellasea TaxID=43670 RepID=UPI0025A472CD|nr:sigma-70 family RNA polymerase sigma factor [Cellulomonas cellasea]MDM8085590.1 sigma-70 family RNA polymerase sigma factor [Cellulomonas cellasea]
MAEWAGALDTLVRERGTALTRYAYLLCSDAREAEDLVQDALVKTFSRSRSLRDPGAIEGYVRQAILTTYLDGFRRRRRWAAIRHLTARDEARSGPERTTPQRLDMMAALDELPPRERACVVLRFYEDLTVPEIATRLDLAAGTVKRYLSDAMRRLETHLGPLDGALDGDVVLTVTRS